MANSNKVDYTAKEINENKASKINFTPQGARGNSAEDSKATESTPL